MRVEPFHTTAKSTDADPNFLLGVLASLSDHFVMFDQEWRYTYVNDAAAQVLGRPKAELLGQRIWDLFPDAVGTYFEQELRRAQQKQINLVFENYYAQWDQWFENRVYIAPQGLALLGIDITERKKAEEQLRESDRRLLLALETARMVAWEWDPVADQLITTDQLAEGAGLPAFPLATQGTALVHPDDLAHHQAAVERVARQGGSYHSHFRMIRPDTGQTVWLEERGHAEMNPAGQVLRVVGVVIDMSERKQAEEALRTSEEKFAKVFHAGPLAITITRLADGRFVEVNETFTQLSGYTRAEALGRTPVELGLWVEPAKRAEGLALLQAGQLMRNTEAQFRMKDGSERTCFISAEQVEIDGEPCVVTVINDITDRKQAESALRMSEANYRALFEGASDGIFIADEAGRYVDVNASACRLSGYARHELLGRHLEELTPPAYHPRLADDQADLAAGGSQTSEWELLRKDGSTLPIEVSVTHLPDGRWQAFVRDITERRRAERHQQFLDELNLRTRLLGDPEVIEQLVIARLGEYLGVDRCIIKAVDLAASTATITHAWGQASEVLAGHTYPLTDFGSPDYIAAARQGHTLVVENMATAPHLAGSQDPLLAHNVQAILRVPCFHQGQWVASLQLAHFAPRPWRADEVKLVESVTYQFWPLIEKARVEQRLRTSEERLRLAVEATGLGIWEMYPDRGEITWSEQCKAIHGLPATTPITRQLVKETIHPADLDAVQGAIRAFYAPPRDRILDTEHRIVRTDGAVRWIRVQGRFVEKAQQGQLPQRSLGTMLDITEQKEAQEALRQSEARLRALTDAVPAMVWTAAPDGLITYANERWFEYVGIAPEENARHWAELVLHPDDYERCVRQWTHALQSGSEYEIEVRNRRYDGAYRWFLTRAVPARDAQGQIIAWYGTTTDIHERKQAEAQLAYHAHLLENMDDAVLATDTEYRITAWNRGAERLYGWQAAEAIGRRANEVVRSLMSDEQRATVTQELNKTGRVRLEVIVHHRNGTPIYTDAINTVLYGPTGEVTGYVAINRDISERKRAEAELRASEERFATAFHASPQPMCITRVEDGGYIDVNESFARMVCYERDEIIGRTSLEIGIWTDPAERAKTNTVILQQGGNRNFEHRFRDRNGKWHEIVSSGQLIELAGQPSILSVVYDVTERKQAEEELAASRRFLERIAQAIPDTLMVYDLASQRILYHNAGLLKTLGLDDKQELTQSQQAIDARIHPEDRARAQAEFARIYTAADDEVIESTFRYRFPNGDYRWLQERTVVFARDGAGAVTQHLSVSRDITERKAAEQDLRFLAELAEQIRLADHADALIQTVAQAVGEHLQVGRCLFIEVDEQADRGLVRGQHSRGLPPVEREYRLSAYSPETSRKLAAGQPLVNADAASDPRTAAHYAATYAPAGERAYIGVPLLREGQWRGILSVTSDQPRQWQAREITLLETVAERTWLAVEKLRLDGELRANERFLQSIADTMPNLLYLFDLAAQRNLYANRQFSEMLGYTAAEAQELGTAFIPTLLHPDDQPVVAAHVARLATLADGEIRQLEYRMRHKNGSWRWLLGLETVFARGGDGQPQTVLGVVQDITERRGMEEALRTSEDRYRNILESITDCFYALDHQWRYTYINAQAERYFGRPRAEMLGQIVWEIFPETVGTAFEASYHQAVKAGRAVHFEVLSPVTNQWVEIHAYPSVDGLSIYFRDISERKQVEQALVRARQEAELAAGRIARLQQITAALTVAATPAELAQVVIRQGAQAAEASAGILVELLENGQEVRTVAALGYPAAAVRTEPVPLAVPTPVSDCIRTGQAIWLRSHQEFADHYPALGKLRGTFGNEATAVMPLTLGERRMGALAFSFAEPRTFAREERGFFLSLAQQCAQALERARLYEAEQRARVELEQRVRERTAELERSNRELDQFAYVASHDLKSPLRGIEHLANFIVQDAAAALPEPSQRHLSLIQGRIKRMEALLDDLLAYSRAGRHRYAAEPLDIALLVGETVELLAPPPGFVVELAEPIPPLVGERVPLETVLRNLIGNAIKHHHNPATGLVRISASDQGEWVEIAVADNGPGIDPLFHQRIFEIYQTLKPRDQVEGSGIGLTMVKKMVETRGGSIWVESTVGTGAIFHFTWPKGPGGAGA